MDDAVCVSNIIRYQSVLAVSHQSSLSKRMLEPMPPKGQDGFNGLDPLVTSAEQCRHREISGR